MDADLKKIKKLTLFMKKEGVLSVKIKDLEINLAPAAVFHVEQSKEKLTDKEEPKQDLESTYTDMDVLMWSVPGILPEANKDM